MYYDYIAITTDTINLVNGREKCHKLNKTRNKLYYKLKTNAR